MEYFCKSCDSEFLTEEEMTICPICLSFKICDRKEYEEYLRECEEE